MSCDQYKNLLPDHWEMIEPSDPPADFIGDDGRDCTKPMFIRKDNLARIYFNQGEEGTEYQFAIAFDYHSDGDCCGTLEEAISVSDRYVATNPLD